MFQTKFGPFNGGTWEGLCQQVFKRKYQAEGYQQMPASPGDYGIEGYTASTGWAFQCYCPEKHYERTELYEKQRDKISTDLRKLKDYEAALQARLGSTKLSHWVFVTPEVDRNALLAHAKTKEAEVRGWKLRDAVRDSTGPQMDLATNIAYLDSQRRMLMRQIAGLKTGLQAAEVRVSELAVRIASKRDLLTAMRGDVTSGASESKAIVRRQVQIEVEVEALERLQVKATELFARLGQIAVRMSANQAARRGISKEAYSAADLERINRFQLNFRANAGSFGYESAQIHEVEIGKDTLVPCLAQMELREIRTDIKSDSSASDFVRLIWSYLLALHQTSAAPLSPGNHLGLLMFDEPGQHSMAVDSQHALLKQLASETSLQSIVAASFDEAEEVFRQATEGVQFTLIEWDGKLLRPVNQA